MTVSDYRDIKISDETVVTIGGFDGVHIGHRFLMEKTRRRAVQLHRKSAVITFSPHPKEFFGSEQFYIITNDRERKLIFDKLGIDYKVFIEFNDELTSLSPADFVEGVLVNAVNCRHVLIGENFYFGKGRAGGAKTLSELCASYGIDSDICTSISYGGQIVSSERIRGLLSDGQIEDANKLLGEPYFIFGEIIHGKSIGRKLGFPTINVSFPNNKLLPKRGVFFTETVIDGRTYYGVTNVGVRPTVDGGDESVETFLFNFSGEVYGKPALVRFIKRSRDEIMFDGIESLKEAILRDKQNAAKFFKICGE